MHQSEPPHHRQWSCLQQSVLTGSSPWMNGCFGPQVNSTSCSEFSRMSRCSASHSAVHPWGCTVHTGSLDSHLHLTSIAAAGGTHTYRAGSSLTWAQSHGPVTDTTPALNITCCSWRYTHIPGGIQSDVGPNSCTCNKYTSTQTLLQLVLHAHTGRDADKCGPKIMYLQHHQLQPVLHAHTKAACSYSVIYSTASAAKIK